nr:hypothetical protein [Paenibacillus antibioticophila]
MLPARIDLAKPGRGGHEEVEATLEQYMAEIEKENNELIDLVSRMKQDFAAKQLSQQEQLVELRQRLSEVERASREHGVKLGELELTVNSAPTKAAEGNSSFQPESAGSALTDPSTAIGAVFSEAAPVLEIIEENVIEEEPQESNNPTVRERYAELFELYAQGKSLDMIAKAVGIQRGEVQLILQLAKKEDSQ